MSERVRLTEVPVPRYRIGQTVFGIGTRDAIEELPCPDCLGSGKWMVRSPAGYESTAQCPRCDGRGKRGLRSRSAFVQKLTVGSIQTTTTPSEYDPPVRYMCEETGVGSGQIWYESKLYLTEAEALPLAEAEAAAERARLEEGQQGEERAEIRYLNKYQMMTAEVKEADRRAWSLGYDLKQLVERIAALKPGEYIYSYGFENEGEGGTAVLDLPAEAVRILQEHLCSFFSNGKMIERLRSAREELEKECKC